MDFLFNSSLWNSKKEKQMESNVRAMKASGGILSNSSNLYFIYAPSLRDYVTFADQAENTANLSSSRQDGNRRGWRESNNWEEAVDTAHKGSQKLCEKFKKLNTVFVSQHTSPIGIEHGVYGNSIDMGRFITGHPECWLQATDRQLGSGGGKIKRIFVNITASSKVKPDIFTRRGVVVASMIDRLEAEGYRTEVDIGYFVSIRDGHYFLSCFNFKRSGDALDRNLLAYATTSKDIFRRIGFSTYERVPFSSWKNDRCSSYGTPAQAKRILHQASFKENYDFTFENKAGSLKSEFGSNKAAKQTYENLMTNYIDDFELEGLNV